MHRDGRYGTERFHLSPTNWGVWEILEKKLVYLAEHIWQKCTDETPIRFPRSINKYAQSSLWVWRGATCTDSFLPVSEMAFVVFFIQYIMVGVEWPLVELMHSSKSISSELVEWASIKEQGDLLKTLTHQATQNGMSIRFFLKKKHLL